MTVVSRMLVIAVLFGFLIGLVSCNSDSNIAATVATIVSTEQPTPRTTPSPSKTSQPTIPVIPSPTPWIDAFQRVTQTSVDRFWWDKTEIRLYYQSNDHLWQYNPLVGRTSEVSPTVPIYGEPLTSLRAHIPDDVPSYDVFFAPSGTKAIYKVPHYEYTGDTPGPDTDSETRPTSITSELWYVGEDELAPRQLGTVEGMPTGVSWDQNENYALVQMGDGMYPPTGSAGWFVSLGTGEMRNLFPVTASETITSYLRPQIVSNGDKVLFTQCVYKNNDSQCVHYIRTLKNGTYSNEVVSPPVSGGFVILPNERGLLIIDEITLYLYDWESEIVLQLSDNRSLYALGSVPMDPPREVKFSPDLHYIAWNGARGLQVFSLCPGAGDLLNCES